MIFIGVDRFIGPFSANSAILAILSSLFLHLEAVLGIWIRSGTRICRIRLFLGLPDPDPDPLVRSV
jgi:hypothetical protein